MNLIFDFDGTICDSFDAARDILKKHFPEYWDRTVSVREAREIGLKKFIKKYKIPKCKLLKMVFVGRKEITKQIPNLKTFPQINVIIDQLSKKYKLGILTTNSKDNVVKSLTTNNLEKYFDFVHSGTNVFSKDKKLKSVMKKYKLNPSETYYIGDETRDKEAAKKVGIKSIAVTWGFESEKALKKARPDYVVRGPEDLLSIFN